MFRFTSVTDVQVRDEDVLVSQLTEFTKRTGQDVLPALGDTVRLLGTDEGTLYLTANLQGIWYWSTEEPPEWPAGLVVARWALIADHGTETDVL